MSLAVAARMVKNMNTYLRGAAQSNPKGDKEVATHIAGMTEILRPYTSERKPNVQSFELANQR